jgi:hypothetical protein
MNWLLILGPAVKLANDRSVYWLFRLIIEPRTAACALLRVARAEPPQMTFELLAGGRDEFLQRSLGKIAVFIIGHLDAGAIYRQRGGWRWQLYYWQRPIFETGQIEAVDVLQ